MLFFLTRIMAKHVHLDLYYFYDILRHRKLPRAPYLNQTHARIGPMTGSCNLYPGLSPVYQYFGDRGRRLYREHLTH